MMNFLSKLLFGLWIFSYTALGFANGDEPLNSAMQAYDQGEFQKSIQLFEEYLNSEDISNGYVFYNLGNAYYKKGDLGRAIAAYLAARPLIPRDPDLEANLKFAMDAIEDDLKPSFEKNTFEKVFLFWLPYMSVKEYYILFIALAAITLVLGSLIFYYRAHHLWLRAFLPSTFSVGIALTLFFLQKSASPVWGAVVQEEVALYSSPSDKSTLLYRLHKGAPLAYSSKQGDWIQVRLSNGNRAWVMSQEVKFF